MQQEQETLRWGLTAGIAASVLYLLSVSGGFFSILISYTPLIPLLIAGLGKGVRAVAIAALVTTLIAGFTTGVSGLLVFGLLYGAPCLMFTHIALTPLSDNRWYPVGGALTGLALYVATSLGLFIAMVMGDASNLSESLPDTAEQGSAILDQARALLDKAPFIVFGLGAWIQLLMFYAIAVFANFMLQGWGKARRADLRLEPFMPSGLVLAVLLVAGLVSFSNDYALQTAGKTAFIILLLPYFLLGIARMHAKAKHWQNASAWLFCIYFLTILVFWPIFWFIGAGIVEQAKFLSNRAK